MTVDITHILNNLNDEQREAVTDLENNLLLLAGAGSGKTLTIVHAIAYIIITGQAHWHQILVVTFTNKAANELKSRVQKLLPNQRHQSLWSGTFHSICHKLLRIHAKDIQLDQNFQVIDTDDQTRIIKSIHKELSLDEQQWPYKKSIHYINAMKEQGLRAKHCFDESSFYLKTQSQIYKAYEEHCLNNNLVDFTELMLKTVEMLKTHENIRWQYQMQFKHIFVDEFQDTNRLQYQLLQLLKANKQRIVAVGDDDQSIYSWRGAIVDHMFSFEKDFSPVRTIRLEQNYRSTHPILTAANQVISHNKKRLSKNLWTENTHTDKIKIYAAYNEIDEAQFVCDQILDLKKDGYKLDDCAILYRSNAQSRAFEEKLGQSNLPYRVYGGLRFFERAEIKDILSYLRLIANPNDNYAFERSINQPPRGIGKVSLDKIKQFAITHQTPLFFACQQCDLSTRIQQNLAPYIQLIQNSQHQFNKLSDLVTHVIETSGIIPYLKTQKNTQHESKVENIEELINAAKFYDKYDSVQTALNEFLSHAILDQNHNEALTDQQVQLMTLHSAKGLEFPIVFLVGVEDDLFPHKMTHTDPDQVEEERRLCYVGITRAMQKLYICYAETRKHYGQEIYQRPSRFIRELPQEVTDSVRTNSAFQSTTQSTYEYKLGQIVTHDKFGEGIVLNYEEDGENSRIQIRFHNSGVKWLLCAYATLHTV